MGSVIPYNERSEVSSSPTMLRIKSKVCLRLTGLVGGVRKLDSTQGGYTQIFYNDLERKPLILSSCSF